MQTEEGVIFEMIVKNHDKVDPNKIMEQIN